MSENKFTPGPWKVIEAGNGLGIIPAKRPRGMSAREVEDIAAIDLGSEQHDARANAHLIAAAPDLLEILEDAIADGGLQTFEDRERFRKTARVLIAKAKGEK